MLQRLRARRRLPAFGRRLGRGLSALLLMLGPIAIGVTLALSGGPVVEQLRNLVFDNYQWFDPRPWRSDLPVRVIDVDDDSLAKLGQWPWPRDRLAEMTKKLDALGALAIAYDITFSEPDRASAENLAKQLPQTPERDALLAKLPSTDEAFAAAVAAGQSVLAFFLTRSSGVETFQPKTGFAQAGDDARIFAPLFPRAVLPLPKLLGGAPGLGAINFLPDRDLVVRKVPLVFALGSSRDKAILVPSLDAELLRVAQGASTIITKASNASGEAGYGAQTGIVAVKIGDLEIPTEWDGGVRIRYSGFQQGRRIPAWRLLADQVPVADIAGRIILIGASATALSDLRSTPLEGAVPGDEIHAELLEHVLSGQHLARPDYAPGLEALAIVIGGLIVGIAARRLSPLAAALIALIFVAGTGGASFYAFHRLDLLFDPLIPAATWLATYGLTTIALYRHTERERKTVRTAFSRYLAPAIVERLAQDPSHLKLGGELRSVTILFADVRDFTRRSEGLTAEAVVHFLNGLMTPLTAAILAEGGTIDKYMGDGLMAFWNAPLDVPDHANRACRAALAMLAAIPEVDAAERQAAEAEGRQHIPVRIGIGLNTGDVFVGNMGSSMRFDYSIVGDPVNVASRLESATKEFGVSVIVSGVTARAATDFAFVDHGDIPLKGKSASTRIFALHGPREEAGDAFPAFAKLHGDAMAAANSGNPGAIGLVEKARCHPFGAPYEVLYTRLFAKCVAAPAVMGRADDGTVDRSAAPAS